MTLEEFLHKRKQFYIDPNSGIVRFPTSKHSDTTHAVWFTDMNYQFCSIMRGYFMETEDNKNDFIMLYVNNYEIPDCTTSIFTYLFLNFPTLKWIGLGCHVGKEGEIWEPKLRIYRNF